MSETQEKPLSRTEWIKVWLMAILIISITIMLGIMVKGVIDHRNQIQAELERTETQDRADFEKIFGVPAVITQDYSEIAKRIRRAKVKAGLLALVQLRIKQAGELKTLWKLDEKTDAKRREEEILALKAQIQETEKAYIRQEFLVHRFVHLFNSDNRPDNPRHDFWWWAKKQIESAPIESAYN